jgi:N6-L-threonylcarbamoyladenine synthase
MKKSTIILAIDTSCDETSVAITDGFKILSNVISSQVDLHRVWGGVVPDIAKRAHQERIDLVIERAFKLSTRQMGRKLLWRDISAIAVTYGPGLAIALEVGINKAKELAIQHEKPLIAVNHLEGHMLSSLAQDSKGNEVLRLDSIAYPALGVIVSGKHTDLVLIKGIGQYEIIWETLDDAIGEAYDKVGRMMDLGYPAGPVVTEFATHGDRSKFTFPIPMKRNLELNFSYSGLKTAVYYLIKKLPTELSKKDIFDISAAFEYAACTHLINKIELAIGRYSPKMVLVGGGVASSPAVRRYIRIVARKYGLKAYFPYADKLYMDNAAMIGVVGHLRYLQGEFVSNPDKLDRVPRARMG